MNLNIAHLHYDNYEINRIECNADAINHAWLFIKCVIELAYGVKESTSEYGNIELIDNCIGDEIIADNLHTIRKLRNQYQHNGQFDIDFDYLKSALDDFIKYVNENNINGFRWKYEDQIQTEIVSHVNLSMEHILIERDSDAFFEHKDERLEWINENDTDIDKYPIAYGDTYNVLSIKDNSSMKNNYPLLSVIHNILTRGATIPESSCLQKQGFISKELGRIYVYEILIIRFICGKYYSNGQTLYYPERDETVVKGALSELEYYLNILGMMSIEKETLPELKPSSELGSTCISNGTNELKGTIGQKPNAIAPVLLSNRIIYEISDDNIKYYNFLLKEIFGLEALKDGQITVLKAIFEKTNNSLVILPTGYGKSLIYQFAAFIQPLITFVISPTDTLIMDQVMNLKNQSVTSVVTVNEKTKLPGKFTEIPKFYSVLAYTCPNAFESESVFNFITELYNLEILNIISIDECHQISLYGHRFEAEYFTLLHQVLAEIPDLRLLLFSATASKRIKEDLYKQLGERQLSIIQPCPLIRDNIEYHIYDKKDFDEICLAILNRFVDSYGTGDLYDVSHINEVPSLTLIICNNENAIKLLSTALFSVPDIGDCCDVFAGEKRKYNEFKNGVTRILITDDAHLAGINIPFLRNVIVVGYPPSKEWLYQESGRVGRGGEQSNVDIYYTRVSEPLIKSMLNEEYSLELPAKWELLTDQYLDCCNLDFLYSLTLYEHHISEAIKTNSDILKMVWIPDGAKYGKVAGSIERNRKDFFDYSLFLLFYLNIIVKWLFRQEDEMLRYGFSINKRVLNGTDYFSSLFEVFVEEESASKEIERKYIEMPNNTFDKLIRNAANWLSENGYYTRHQMFMNTFQFVKVAGTSDSRSIEEALTSYFGVYAQDNSEIWAKNQYRRTSKLMERMKQKLNKPKVELNAFGNKPAVETNEKSEPKTVSNSNNKSVNANSTVEHCGINDEFLEKINYSLEHPDDSKPECAKPETGTCNINDYLIEKAEKDIDPNTAYSNEIEPECNTIATEAGDGNEALSKPIVATNHTNEKDGGHLRSNSIPKSCLLRYCTEYNEIRINPVKELYENLIQAVSDNGYIKVQAEVERELESHSNILCEIALILIELIYSKGKSFLHSERFLLDNNIDEYYRILDIIEQDLHYKEKTEIDNMLKEKGYSEHYYCGFGGSIRRVIDRILKQ